MHSDEDQQFKIYVDQPFTNESDRYISQAYMSSFITGGTIGNYFQMRLDLKAIQPGLHYQIIIINVDKQILISLKFIYLLIDISSYLQKPLFQVYRSQASDPSVTISKYFQPNHFQKCIFGLYKIYVFNVSISSYELKLLFTGQFTYDYHHATNNQVFTSVFCMGFCYSWEYADATSPSIYYNKCSTCPITCLTCSNLTYCITCKAGYYLFIASNYYQSCIPCLQDCLRCKNLINCTTCLLGIPTQNGCSVALSCRRVNRSYNYTDNRCTQCIYPSILASNRTCVCPKPSFLVTGLCTNVIGCSSAYLLPNGAITCLTCKLLDNFLLYPESQKCLCKQNYELDGNNCVQICGDKFLYELQCDDGNSINEDGCSSACLVQSGFSCPKNVTNATSENCVYIRKDIKLSLKKVHKITFENKAIFTFQIFPTFLRRNWINIKNNSFFQSTQKLKIIQTFLYNSELIIFLQFFQDLQDYQASINLIVNHYYALQKNVTFTFKMQDNGKLILIKNLKFVTILQYVYFSINLLIVVVFFISMFIHKMIVIQLIFPIQLLYLAFSFFGEQSTVTELISFAGMSCFDMLSSFNLVLNPYEEPNQLQNIYSSFLLTSALEIFILILFLAIFTIINFQKNEENQNNLRSKLQAIYYNCLFPFTIALLPISQTLYGWYEFNHKLSISFKFINIGIKMLISLVFFSQWKKLFIQKHLKITIRNSNIYLKQRYTGAYLSLIWISSLLLLLWNNKQIGYPQIYLITLIICFIAFVTLYQPYRTVLSNIGIIVNMLPSLSVLIYILLRRCKYIEDISQQNSFMNIIIILFLILCSISITIARLIITIKQQCSCKEQTGKMERTNNEDQSSNKRKIDDIKMIIKKDLQYFYAKKPIQDQIKKREYASNYTYNRKNQSDYKNLKAILLGKIKNNTNIPSFQ